MIELDGRDVSIDDVVRVARHAARVELTPDAIDRMTVARDVVERLAEGEPKYGISTGFGALATVSIPPERRRALQLALIRSHAAGMGEPVEVEVVRAMVFLRARTLAMGHSGARPLVAQAMLDLVNADITPIVPEYGSLGASGDLAPLAHGALAMLGPRWPRSTGGRCASRRRSRPNRTRREGRPRRHQRHRCDPGDALSGRR